MKISVNHFRNLLLLIVLMGRFTTVSNAQDAPKPEIVSGIYKVKPFKVTAADKNADLGTDLATLIDHLIMADAKGKTTGQAVTYEVGGKITQFEMQNLGKLVSRWNGTVGTGDPTISLIMKLSVANANAGTNLLTHKFIVEAKRADTTGSMDLWQGIDTKKYNKIEAAGLYKAATQIVAFLAANEAVLMGRKEKPAK